jgi:hypothetical protein
VYSRDNLTRNNAEGNSQTEREEMGQSELKDKEREKETE